MASANPASYKSTPRDQQSVAVTVYNNNLGLVKDIRSLSLPAGTLELIFEGVAASIDPTSVHIRSINSPDKLAVLEQNFEYDLVSPDKLARKYLGLEVELVPKEGKAVKARLIGIEGGYVYEIGDKIAINPPGHLRLPSLPEGLVSKPSLVWLLDNRSKEQVVEASYLTSSIEWKANYIAVLSEDDRRLDLSGWVTVNNKSGATYKNATLKLVAGDVHRIERRKMRRRISALGKALVEAEAPALEERAFFEYHIYKLPRKTTIKNYQTKQITLMDANSVSVTKSYVYSPQRLYFFSSMGEPEKKGKVGVFLSLENSKDNNLGVPLPKGIVRVYKKDEDGTLEFVGEDEIDHTPEDEKIRIKMGEAFDIVVERVQTDFKFFKRGRLYESAYQIIIRNHKEEDVTVSILERLPGDWKIKENSHDYIKESAHKVRFDIPVGNKGQAVLTYRVLIKR